MYVLNKHDMEVKQGNIVSKSFPHINNTNVEMVVDIVVDIDGKNATYVLPETASVAFNGDNVITPDISVVLTEIANTKRNSEQVIASVPHHNEIIRKANELAETLDPALREKRVTEDRISSLESSVGNIESKIDQLINTLNITRQ